MSRSSKALRKPVPGPTFRVVRWVSAIDAVFFALLLFFWLAPGFEKPTMYAGWAHGLGFVALCLVIWLAILRREAPYTLLAATLTPVGPFGSVIAIELINRRLDPTGSAAHAGENDHQRDQGEEEEERADRDPAHNRQHQYHQCK